MDPRKEDEDEKQKQKQIISFPFISQKN